jgi:hypothetical protein
MGWSRDSRQLWLLIVKEPDDETGSLERFEAGEVEFGGWTLADLQRFWLALGAWGAVNIDGGDVTQLLLLRPVGRYDLVPPWWADRAMRRTLGPDLAGAPAGGTLMYFYMRDTGL